MILELSWLFNVKDDDFRDISTNTGCVKVWGLGFDNSSSHIYTEERKDTHGVATMQNTPSWTRGLDMA